ncbi:hypothetical protein Tco_0941204 [Tanacetum coccineum]|uniref:Uncharacterized protein n=1 Tax=Tanacetum coccineum TaxID=301880 RepID=A0ABQ5DW67_9ASTR
MQEVRALDASSGNIESSRIVSDKWSAKSLENDCNETGNDQSSGNESNTSRNASSRSGNECSERSNSGNDTGINPSYDTEPMAEEFDAEPVTLAMMALTEVEQDDWSIEFDAEHMHFGQDGLGDFLLEKKMVTIAFTAISGRLLRSGGGILEFLSGWCWRMVNWLIHKACDRNGEVIRNFLRTRDGDLDTRIDDYPSYYDNDKKIHIDCAHNLKFSCMIGFEFTHVNFFPLLYVNVMSKKFHNSIMKDKMVYKGDNVVGALMNVPIFVGTFSVVTHFAVLEDMDAYCDEGMGEVIVGEPLLREVGIKASWFDGMITIYNGDAEVSEKDERDLALIPKVKEDLNVRKEIDELVEVFTSLEVLES